MAFGASKGTLVGSGNSITNPAVASGSVAVAVGDVVYVVIGEQTSLTAGAVTDNLGNTYTALNAGTTSGAITARPYYSIVTVAGTLTTINVAATASANNFAVCAQVVEGPVNALDTNPANGTDVATPFTCPSTGTLATANEIVVCFNVHSGSGVWSATSPNNKGAEQATQTVLSVTLGYQAVAVTTAVAPAFTGTNPTSNITGTASFKQLITAAVNQTTAANIKTIAGGPVATASASQTSALGTQSATGSTTQNRAVIYMVEFEGAGAIAAAVSQTTALPSQTAAGDVDVVGQVSQTTVLASKTIAGGVRVSASANQTTIENTRTIAGDTDITASVSQTTVLASQTAGATASANQLVIYMVEFEGTPPAVASASQTTEPAVQTVTGGPRVTASVGQTTVLPSQTAAGDIASGTANRAVIYMTEIEVGLGTSTASVSQTTVLPSQTAVATVEPIPTLTWVTVAGDLSPEFDISGITLVAGDYVRAQADNDSDFSSPFANTLYQLTSGDIAAGTFTLGLPDFPGGLAYVRVRKESGTIGSWSNAASQTLISNNRTASVAQTTDLPTKTVAGTVRVRADFAKTTLMPAQTVAGTGGSGGSVNQTTVPATINIVGDVDISVSVGQTTAPAVQNITGTVQSSGKTASVSQITLLGVQTVVGAVRVVASVGQTTDLALQDIQGSATVPATGTSWDGPVTLPSLRLSL